MKDILSFLKEEFDFKNGISLDVDKTLEVIRALEDYAARIEYLKEKLREQEEVWRLRVERAAKEWQLAHDREIVMGEKIKRLKEFAEKADRENEMDINLLIDILIKEL